MRKTIAAIICLLAVAPVGEALAASLGPYRGTGSGNILRNGTSNDTNQTRISRDSYAGHFSYFFNIDPSGNITGSGAGAHDSALWHLEGSGDLDYSCDVPLIPSGFTVTVTGQVDNGVAKVRFELVNAIEYNAEQPCPPDETALETTTTHLAQSLDYVQDAQGGQLSVNLGSPAIGTLRAHLESPFFAGTRVTDAIWDITITPPPPPEDIGRGNAGPGGATGPNDPRAEICTIKGNNKNNVLNGTSGDDIICGFAGKDRINGRGGNDIIFGGKGDDVVTGAAGKDSLYGNSGNDRIRARDGAKDLVDGGPGTDTATRDRIDRVRGVP